MRTSPAGSRNVVVGEVLASTTERSETPLYDAMVRKTGIDPRTMFEVRDGAGRLVKHHCNWNGHLIYGG